MKTKQTALYVRELNQRGSLNLKRRAIKNILHKLAGEDYLIEDGCTILPLDGEHEHPTIQVYLLTTKGDSDLVEVTPAGVTYVCTFPA